MVMSRVQFEYLQHAVKTELFALIKTQHSYKQSIVQYVRIFWFEFIDINHQLISQCY